jgi:hypothetical protein
MNKFKLTLCWVVWWLAKESICLLWPGYYEIKFDITYDEENRFVVAEHNCGSLL